VVPIEPSAAAKGGDRAGNKLENKKVPGMKMINSTGSLSWMTFSSISLG